MASKKIKGAFPALLTSQEGYQDLLKRENIRCLVNPEGLRIYEYAALVDGETYTAGPELAEAKAGSKELEDLRRDLNEMKINMAIVESPQLALFNGLDGCGSDRFLSSFKSYVKRRDKQRCVICSTKANVTVAHIIGGTQDAFKKYDDTRLGLNLINKPKFKDDYEFDSARNAITLCGSKSEEGSCHWAFDNHRVGIIYNGLNQKYEVTWYVRSCLKPEQLAVKELTVAQPLKFNPYKRGLAYHALAGALRHRRNNQELTFDFLRRIEQLAELSISQEEAKGGSSGSSVASTASVASTTSSSVTVASTSSLTSSVTSTAVASTGSFACC